MLIIENLKDYVDVLDDESFKELADSIYEITDFICEDYPSHKEWYYKKQLPATKISNERNILFARNPKDSENIIAMACLKKDDEEKKICILYVSDKCRGIGIGTKMIEASMDWLETTKPLATLADYKLDMFRPIIRKYDWKLTQIVSGLYNDRSEELCFNGVLAENSEPIEKQLYMKLASALRKGCNHAS